jgi:hypothetical protein
MTDAPLSATTGAGDAAGGGVNWTGGLHAPATNSAASDTANGLNCMMIPWRLKMTRSFLERA